MDGGALRDGAALREGAALRDGAGLRDGAAIRDGAADIYGSITVNRKESVWVLYGQPGRFRYVHCVLRTFYIRKRVREILKKTGVGKRSTMAIV